MKPAVFIDRDGTLNVSHVVAGVPHPPSTLDEFELLPGVADACHQLKSAGFWLVVVTNQPDVGRGTQTREVVESMNDQLRQWIPAIDRVEVCYAPGRGVPHADNYRRKPEPGMLLDAARELGLALDRSWMVGDRAGDIDAGHAAGCRTILVASRQSSAPPLTPPHHSASSFIEATEIILSSLRALHHPTSSDP